jgi:hypothetical protein
VFDNTSTSSPFPMAPSSHDHWSLSSGQSYSYLCCPDTHGKRPLPAGLRSLVSCIRGPLILCCGYQNVCHCCKGKGSIYQKWRAEHTHTRSSETPWRHQIIWSIKWRHHIMCNSNFFPNPIWPIYDVYKYLFLNLFKAFWIHNTIKSG